LGLNIVYLGYDITTKRNEELFVRAAPQFYQRIESLRIVNSHVEERMMYLYVGHSLSLSHRLKKIIETTDPKATVVFGQKSEKIIEPEEIWNPPSTSMGEFLQGLDLDGFTGERP
jgi:hypothetical protein